LACYTDHLMATGQHASLVSPISVGDLLLERYRIVELLAEGGHSSVYRAQDERLRRPACIKLLRRSAIDPIFRAVVEQRFVQEAFLLARLVHPSIIRVYDFGRLRSPRSDEADLPFQVCELISGGPLSRWVKRRIRLDPLEVLALILPLSRALAEVHGAGLVHLDVKPQNILLVKTPSGREPKLADFGIAQAASAEVPDGTNSVLLYSVNWAAPEQMVGDPLGASCDVYSLALVTAYALTGRLIYQDSDPAEAYRLRKYSNEVLGNALSACALPDQVIAVLLRACRFNPAERIGDVMEFSRQLRDCLGALPSGVLRVPLPPEDSGSTAVDLSPVDRSLPGRVTAANLWPLSVAQPCPDIGGRALRFVPLTPHADIEPEVHIRLRLSLLPASADRAGLHILGLNCFVSVAGRRPSNAVTLEGSAALQFFSAGGELLGVAEASFATAGPQRSVVMVAGHLLVVPLDECPHLIALDFGEGRTCALLYENAA
jgi:eukaryotic-like serine/threonine-protein kinase